MNNLVYCDVETTGLQEAAGHILEIGLLAVALPHFEVVARFESVVVPPCWDTVLRNMPERVREMHQVSGLLAAVAQAALQGGYSASEVETRAGAFMQQWSPKTLNWQTPMAGANPSFDRRWLEKHMPKLAKRFHYRSFDVRTITFLQTWIDGAPEPGASTAHRALADCIQANDTVRAFLGLT